MNQSKSKLRVNITFQLINVILVSLAYTAVQSDTDAKLHHTFMVAAGTPAGASAAAAGATAQTPLKVRVGIITNYTGTQSYVKDIGALGLALDRIVADQLVPNVQFEYVRVTLKFLCEFSCLLGQA